MKNMSQMLGMLENAWNAQTHLEYLKILGMLENSWNAEKCSEYSKMLERLKGLECLNMQRMHAWKLQWTIYEKFNTQSKHKKIRKTTFRISHRMFL